MTYNPYGGPPGAGNPPMGGGYPQQMPPFPPYQAGPQPGPYGMPYPGPPGGGGYGPQPQLAGWWRRFGATLLDGIIMELPTIVCLVIGARMRHDIGYQVINGDLYQVSALTSAGRALVIVGIALIFVDMLIMLVLKGGRGSIGQRIVGIRMIREQTGAPTGFWLALGRQILHILDGLPLYLGYLWPIWDRKKQTFADKLVNTIVIRTR